MAFKYHIITFGCQMNKSDSEKIDFLLGSNGYKKTAEIEEADLIIINMCSVRQSAVDRVYGLARKFKELRSKNPDLKLILTGCFLKEDRRKFKNLFDFILPIKALPYWPELLKKESHFFHASQRSPNFTEKYGLDYLKTESKPKRAFSAFVPISTGCNNFCSYCVVPHTRGPLTCRSHRVIVKEAEGWIQKDIKEIWLLGQNVNDYSSPESPEIKFPELLKMVNDLPGDFWLRFHSPNPKDFSKKLIKNIRNCKKVTEYLNLPVQSGDNGILKRMNRPYTVEEYKDLVKEIRKEIPEIALSTDVIVGFPGETKEQFQNTVKLFKEIKFDMAYIAEYSPRSETKAFEMEDTVPREEKERRRELLTKILKETSLENNKRFIGKTVKILVEAKKRKKERILYFGKNREFKTVKFFLPLDFKKDLVGSFVDIKISKALSLGLQGDFMTIKDE
ncbi:MAG: tRNA (N6-isopentenyl adenosine(37)-C2)-methylthiotransferase MiaB [Candidatus Nealsonbacteria bacterium]|nr:tRNA (N6-isopentenyl adenosine(37)-C2)-methylthiotransferase MiaB [Candidatus Nealsonbacteria bacterium]